ncbi:DUF4177 domain-containing protein [Agrococcus casei]|uniref:DUF4177 domain-containing protein n=1 Tax=Agrococcus casei TaxID=343512 RepID=UPI003F903A9F
MREYSFVSIPIVRRRPGASLTVDYQEEIRQRASSGWDFVQAITFDADSLPHIDLVFTREAEK